MSTARAWIDPVFGSPQVYCAVSGSPCQADPAPPHDPDPCPPFSGYCGYSHPFNLDVGDIMGPASSTLDGYPEVAVLSTESTNGSLPTRVSIFRNRGINAPNDAQLELQHVYEINPPGGGVGYDIQFADIDGDNKLDLVISLDNPAQVAILFNDGTGNYPSTPEFITLSMHQAFGLVVGDFDGDGDQDIAVAGANAASRQGQLQDPCCEILLNAGGGSFGTSTVVRVDPPVIPPDVPLNGEGTDLKTTVLCPPQVGGRLDLVMSMAERDETHKQVALIRQVPDGPVNWESHTIEGRNSGTLGVLKLTTGATRPDFVINDDNLVTHDRIFRLLHNDAGGCLSYAGPAETLLGVGRSPFFLDTGYYPYDTKPDVLVACTADTTVCSPGSSHGLAILLQGNGTGGFKPNVISKRSEKCPCCPKPCVPRVVDLNADGLNDILVSNTLDGSITFIPHALSQ